MPTRPKYILENLAWGGETGAHYWKVVSKHNFWVLAFLKSTSVGGTNQIIRNR